MAFQTWLKLFRKQGRRENLGNWNANEEHFYGAFLVFCFQFIFLMFTFYFTFYTILKKVKLHLQLLQNTGFIPRVV